MHTSYLFVFKLPSEVSIREGNGENDLFAGVDTYASYLMENTGFN